MCSVLRGIFKINTLLLLGSETLILFKLMLLKEVLKLKGVKQNWLAKKLGVSEVTVSNWVQGKSEPTKKHLEKISQVLNFPLQDMMS